MSEMDTAELRGRLPEMFHEAYERLAPSFSYETRKASAKPWAEVPENNRKLMTAVCNEMHDAMAASYADALTAAKARIETLETLATKVDAIRNSIIGKQGFNFSEHAYPLVAALGEAGYPGQGYEIARKNLGTLIERNKAAEAQIAELRAALKVAKKALHPFAWADHHYRNDHVDNEVALPRSYAAGKDDSAPIMHAKDFHEASRAHANLARILS